MSCTLQVQSGSTLQLPSSVSTKTPGSSRSQPQQQPQQPATPTPVTPSADEKARAARKLARLVGRTLSVDIHAPLDPQAALLKSIQVVRSVPPAVRWGHLPAATFFSLPLSEVRPTHVAQGEVLDGSFLCAVAALSLEGRLASLLVPPRVPDPDDPDDIVEPDTYTFRFHHFDTDSQQVKQPRISVSALVPVEKETNLPLGAALRDQVGWAALLEKAWATHLGGYDKLHAGAWPSAPLFALTGVIPSTLELKAGEGRKPVATFEDAQELLQRSRGTLMLVTSQRPSTGPPTPSVSAAAAAVATSATSAGSASSTRSLGSSLSSLAVSVRSPLLAPPSSSPSATAPSPSLSPRPTDYGQTYALIGLRVMRDDKTGEDVELAELWAPWPVQQQMQPLREADENSLSTAGVCGDESESETPMTQPVPLLPGLLARSWAHWSQLQEQWAADTLRLDGTHPPRDGSLLVLPWRVLVEHEEFQQIVYSDL